MNSVFVLEDAQDALDYLDTFDRVTRRKGEDYFRQGRVGELVCQEPGTEYSATVQGSMPYQVSLRYDRTEGWLGDCTCPMEVDCKHAYAAMKALLAENSVAAVRTLSAGGSAKADKATATASAGPKPPAGALADQLAAALGRALKPDEVRFLHKVNEVYRRCTRTRHITRWDFEDMDLSLGGHSWDTLQIWPSFPPTEQEFWLYVANTALEHGRTIPDFLQPISDVRPIQARLRQWRRARAVQHWQYTLQHGQQVLQEVARPPRGEYDLRVALGAQYATLLWKRPGQEAFEPMKTTQFSRFAEDCEAGLVELPPEAELLWNLYRQRLGYSHAGHLSYRDTYARTALNRLLRQRTLASRIVNEDGQPLVHATAPLHWDLAPAASEEDDYRLRLVQADGAPLPPLLCTLTGQPTLYVTRHVVFPGPPVNGSTLDPSRENVIPAPALETPHGVRFLQALRVELPARIRERIQTVPVDVAITCELKPTYPGSKSEACTVRVLAESKDRAVQELWNGQSWMPASYEARPARAKGGARFIVYDRTVLQGVPQLLEPLGLKWDGYHGCLQLRITKKFPEVFAAWLKSVPPHIPVRLAGELATLAQDAVSGNVRLDVSETAIDWFDLQVVLDVSDTTLSPAELKLLLDARGAWVRLKGKGWRRLQFNLTEEDDERLARLGLNPHELTSEPQRLHALQLADEAARKFLPEEQVAHIQRRVSEIKARVTPEIPTVVTAQMRPYQVDGFHFLAYLATNRFGGILADDMGLGKTLQTLAWLVWLRSETAAANPTTVQAPSLVVCPKSVMDNWQAEARRFTPGLRVKPWPASELNTFHDRLVEADLHVLNYSQLRLLGESLVPKQWLAVILDEGQYIKNPSSQTAQVARALRAEHRLVLSGTPIENRLLDLWSLMAFAMPGVLGSRPQFARLYDARNDPFARRRLASRVRPFLIRRTKAQVAKDLPDRIEEDLYCEMEGEQKTLYRAEFKRAQQLLLRVKTQKELAQERFHFLTALLRLRQICCHPALVNPDSKFVGAKVEALLEQLEPLMDEGHKVLVFSQFVELLNLLKPVLATRGWPLFYLAGDTENRGDLVQRFQSAEGGAVFLISLKAGGFGLNLTAASYVVLFDPWWNPAVENQAIDRTHRIGQANNVIAYRLLIKESIEEKIRALQKQKKSLAEDVLGEEKFAQSLTLEDLQYLFAD